MVKIRTIFAVFALFFISAVQPLNLKDLKGTHDLVQEHPELWVGVGASWWETHLVESFYRHGHPNHATMKLIRELFHAPNEANFNPTTIAKLPGAHLTPGMIGQIMRAITLIQDKAALRAELISIFLENHDFQAAVKRITAEHEELGKQLKKLDQEDSRLRLLAEQTRSIIATCAHQLPISEGERNHLIRQANHELLEILRQAKKERVALTDEKIAEILQKAQVMMQRFMKDFSHYFHFFKDDLLEYNAKLKQLLAEQEAIGRQETRLKKLQNNCNPASMEKRVAKLVDLIISSLHECDPAVATPQYVPCTTQFIFMSLLYAKTQTKADLMPYYAGLGDLVPAEQQATLQSPEWLAQEFERSQVQPIIERLQTSVEQAPEDQKISAALSAVSREEIVYAELMSQYYIGSLPKLFKYVNISFPTTMGRDITYANCMEVMIRNLCNIVAYDDKVNNFVAQNSFSQELKDFYQTHSSAALAGSHDVHKAWAPLVEHQPLVAYCNMINRQTRVVHQSGQGVDGFMFGLPQELIARHQLRTMMFDGAQLPVVKFGDLHYVVAPADQYYCYELLPSMPNVILLLNRLLGLQLYDAPQEAELLTQETFKSIYFPALCDNLGWEYDQAQVNAEALDKKNDYKFPMCLKLNAQHAWTFSLNLEHGHVESTENIEKNSHRELLANAVMRRCKSVAQNGADGILFPLYGAYVNFLTAEKTVLLWRHVMLWFTSLAKNHGNTCKARVIIDIVKTENTQEYFYFASRWAMAHCVTFSQESLVCLCDWLFTCMSQLPEAQQQQHAQQLINAAYEAYEHPERFPEIDINQLRDVDVSNFLKIISNKTPHVREAVFEITKKLSIKHQLPLLKTLVDESCIPAISYSKRLLLEKYQESPVQFHMNNAWEILLQSLIKSNDEQIIRFCCEQVIPNYNSIIGTKIGFNHIQCMLNILTNLVGGGYETIYEHACKFIFSSHCTPSQYVPQLQVAGLLNRLACKNHKPIFGLCAYALKLESPMDKIPFAEVLVKHDCTEAYEIVLEILRIGIEKAKNADFPSFTFNEHWEILQILVTKNYEPAKQLTWSLIKQGLSYAFRYKLPDMLRVLTESHYVQAYEETLCLAKEFYQKCESINDSYNILKLLPLVKALVQADYKPAYEFAEQAARAFSNYYHASEILKMLELKGVVHHVAMPVDESAESSRKREREDDDQAGNDAPAAHRQRTESLPVETLLARMNQRLIALFNR